MKNDEDINIGKSESDYRPIPCDLYSEYEVAILHKERLRLHWLDEEGMDHIDRVIPTDLQTHDHREYLVVQLPAGERLTIRLDKIVKCEQEA